MSKRLTVCLAGLFLLTCAGCGANPATSAPAAEPSRISSPRQVEQDLTPLATPTDLPPTPTETLLPTPELPTPISLTPVLEIWTGTPILTESQPGYAFNVNFDASLWALTVDETGATVLLNRQIPYCKIAPAAGRGLPRGWTVDDQFREIGALNFEVVTASQNGTVQFINYFGGDGVIVTGFQVSFQEQQDACVRMAEIVLASLSSVVAPTATPTPESTLTLTDTPTP